MPDSISFDPIAAQYDNTRSYAPDVAAQIADGLMRLGRLTAGDHALEIGVGTGRIALPLLERGLNVTGVDISAGMMERMQAKLAALQAAEPQRPWGALTTRLADMTDLPFADGAFAAVIGVHIFHLVSKWRRALDEALRVLTPGGALLIGQDMRDVESLNHIYEQLEAIIASLGLDARNVGASGYTAVVRELRGRGLPVEETVIATWLASFPPRSVLESITKREWSKTWRVPDDLFAESTRLLTDWAKRTYGDALDQYQTGSYSFKVALVRRPHQ